MTIEVTQADRDLVMAIAMLVNDTGITIPERLRGAEGLCARHRIEAQRPLLEALEKAEKTFRWYGDLHAAKPDTEKAARNYELADEMRAAIKQAKGD